MRFKTSKHKNMSIGTTLVDLALYPYRLKYNGIVFILCG